MDKCSELFEEVQNLRMLLDRKESELYKAQTECAEEACRKNYSYWASHGGVRGKCFKERDDFLKRNNYYRVYKLVDNGFKGSNSSVALEHIIIDDDSDRWPYRGFRWDECFALSTMRPENEIPLSEFNEARAKFFAQLESAVLKVEEEKECKC